MRLTKVSLVIVAVFILCHSVRYVTSSHQQFVNIFLLFRWIPNMWEMKQAGTDLVSIWFNIKIFLSFNTWVIVWWVVSCVLSPISGVLYLMSCVLYKVSFVWCLLLVLCHLAGAVHLVSGVLCLCRVFVFCVLCLVSYLVSCIWCLLSYLVSGNRCLVSCILYCVGVFHQNFYHGCTERSGGHKVKISVCVYFCLCMFPWLMAVMAITQGW